MRKMLVMLMAGISITAISLADGGGSTAGAGKFVCTQYDMKITVSTLTEAKNWVTNSVLSDSAPVTKTYSSIAFTDSSTVTYAFPCVMWPGSSAFNDGKDAFVVLATAKIVIPETGDWTFACYSDDGFELKLSNGGNEYTMSFEESRVEDYTLRTFNLAAGIYDLNLTYFENSSGAVCFLCAAKGTYLSFDATAFKLVGDAANGIALANTSAITFDANGGTVMPSAVVCLKDRACGPLPIPSKACHVFDGWYTAPEGGEKIIPETVFDNDIRLYAHWRRTIGVSNVEVVSGSPWQEVAIGYKITGRADRPVWIKVLAMDNTTGETFECKTLKGVSLDEGYHVIKWDVVADGRKFNSSQVVFTVKVVDPPYCVIDLSGGASAASYPVTELMDVPNGGWTDEYKTTKLVLRRIDAGSFIVGDDQANEAHRVTLTKPFYMGVFEVTQKQWSLVMGTNPCSSTSYGRGDNYPVHNVSYDMVRGNLKWPLSPAAIATTFSGRLKAKTGLDFDLPTEAQWEYACRAGTTTTYYWGNSMDGDYAWYTSNSGNKTHPVGTKRPNAWGLYDMSGNVWEWNLDWYNSSLSYGTDPKGSSSGSSRVRRGGGWSINAGYCTSSYRNDYTPSYSGSYYGFRLVRTLSN